MLVGGVVRDFLMYSSAFSSLEKCIFSDVDIEVFGLSVMALESVLHPFRADFVGRSFGVYKLRVGQFSVDVSMPRRERHNGLAHNDVVVDTDSEMSFAEAASRRDFTINAMGFDWISEQFLDPFDGRGDMSRRVIRHVGPVFSEDPLRVFRAARFAARFEFEVANETVHLCQKMNLTSLSRERVWEELVRLFAYDAGLGLYWYRRLGCLSWYPELDALVGVPQDPNHHPEGDVWRHTCLALSTMRQIAVPLDDRLCFGLSVLCHDLGKSVTTAFRSGRWRALGHEGVGGALARKMLSRIGCPRLMQTSVVSLVKAHMAPMQLYAVAQMGRVSDAAIQRLACRVSIEKLAWLATADHNGRGRDFEPDPPAVGWLRRRAQELSVYHAPPKALLGGRDLLSLGVVQGPVIGVLLTRLFAAQLRGAFATKEEAVGYAQRLVRKN